MSVPFFVVVFVVVFFWRRYNSGRSRTFAAAQKTPCIASRTKEKCDALKEKLQGTNGYSDHDSEGGCG